MRRALLLGLALLGLAGCEVPTAPRAESTYAVITD